MAEKAPAARKELTLEEAAEYIGMTPDEIMASRGRGLPPGIAGYKKEGVLVWDQTRLQQWVDAHSEEEQ